MSRIQFCDSLRIMKVKKLKESGFYFNNFRKLVLLRKSVMCFLPLIVFVFFPKAMLRERGVTSICDHS
jgi:hypothetical protein